MSLSKWKELAAEKSNTGKMKQNLFDEITAEKIRSKTTDQAIAKTFRLDRLDQIAEQTRPKAKKVVQIPRINRDGGIDYAPEVDPFEDMDVEGLLNLEDYFAPEAEKQIAKIPKEASKYEMDQLPTEPPPPYEDEGFLTPPEDEDEVDLREANKILDQLDLPNYDYVENILAQTDMSLQKQKHYLDNVVKSAEFSRKQAVALKSNATKDFNKGKISEAEKNLQSKRSDKLQKEIKDYKKHFTKILEQKYKEGKGIQKGRGAFF